MGVQNQPKPDSGLEYISLLTSTRVTYSTL